MKRNPRKKPQSGFALIVTLSLMILLTVIAVGLLSLSSISLRTAGAGNAASVARSNAKLAMMLALGELQKTMGVDKSVSAPASSVFDTTEQPHLTGTWSATNPDDWHWTPTPGGSPSFSSKKSNFRGWLVSSSKPSDAEVFDFAKPAGPTGIDAVTLVGSTTSPLKDSENNSTTVVAAKVKVGSARQMGKFGWAVFDESTKASIDLGDPTGTQTAGLEIASRTVPNRMHADVLDSVKLASLKSPKNLISLETATVPAGAGSSSEFRRRFHDFTTATTGLLTDTANGGLKTDLTPLFEAPTLPAGAFVAPTTISPYPSSFNTAWGAPRWSFIRDHYRKYKTVTSASAGESTYSLLASTAKDLRINNGGINPGDQPGLSPSPDTERLLPVIAKFQLVFSLVCHTQHINSGNDKRIDWWNQNAPGGNAAYAAVHLAYDPVFTLYNPYDVTLNMAKMRIRVWDPPVGFRFTKIDNQNKTKSFFRTGGEFLGLARFQADNQTRPEARKCFTLLLTDGTSEAAGGTLRLKPGEVKVFSPRVQKNWTWGWETSDQYNPKAFFDFGAGNQFANIDFRTKNKFGVETVPGWEPRAGLQTDHLATNNPRDDASKYQFEKGRNDGYVVLRLTDEVKVEAKPVVTSAAASKQFQVDVLAGAVEGSPTPDNANSVVKGDTLRSYSFTFAGADPAAELSANPAVPISQQFIVKDMWQQPTDTKSEFKKPFAVLKMSARTTRDPLTDSKPWLYNNPVVEGGEQDSNKVGLSAQSYDLRLTEMTSFRDGPTGISVDDANHGFFGAGDNLGDGGSSFMSMLHIPLAPAASLGDLIPTNMASGSVLPRVVHPFGNSRAHPLIASDKVTQTISPTTLIDHSYLLNNALWDSYFFSSITDYTGGTGQLLPEGRTIDKVLKGVLSGKDPALNSRLASMSQGEPTKQAAEILGLGDLQRSRQIAKYVGVKGPFNVNSTSEDAWKSVLFSLREREINGLQVGTSGAPPTKVSTVSATSYANKEATPFVRLNKPLAGTTSPDGLLWAGFRVLTDTQIETLAKQIVIEIKAGGVEDSAPALSLGEFVNRRPGSASALHSLAGILQTAIDKSKINEKFLDRDSKPGTMSGAAIPSKRRTGIKTLQAMDGQTAEGAPSVLTQGDLMMALAPIATVRGDTFKIRSFGEATSADGTTVLARAWCETVVQRVPDFVDSSDVPETTVASLTAPANRTFGRRFNVVSFRWLNENEL